MLLFNKSIRHRLQSQWQLVLARNLRLLVWCVPGLAAGTFLAMQEDFLVGRVAPLALVAVWLWFNRGILRVFRNREGD